MRRARRRSTRSRTARPLSIGTGGRTSSTLRPQWIAEPGGLRLLREPLEVGERGLLVGHAAPVEGGDRALVLDPDPQQAQLRGVALAGEAAHAPLPALEGRHHARARAAPGLEQLGAVGAGVGDPADAHQPPGLGRRAAGDARHAAVAAREPAQQERHLLAHVGVLGAPHDRRQRAVDVAEDAGPLGASRSGRSASASASAVGADTAP